MKFKLGVSARYATKRKHTTTHNGVWIVCLYWNSYGGFKMEKIPLFELKITGAKYRDICDFISSSTGFVFDLYPEHSKFNIHRKASRESGK